MFDKPITTKRSSKYGSNYWYVFSPKMNRMVHLFSDLEYDHWVLVESNCHITHFCEQPKRIQISFDNTLVTSVFDMWVKRVDGSECFIEVKYKSELDPNNPKSKRSLRQTTIQKMWCEENGYDYLVQTENEIRKNHVLLDNLKQIIPYIRYNRIPNEMDHYQITKTLQNQRLTFKQIRDELNHLSVSRLNTSLYYMIYSGELDSNINEVSIGLTTEVWKHGIQEAI
ncbi:S-layer protein [Brevibacillus sp. 7WMA2]|uniref:TnsA endonuclease N-terminal domain-containing protein n=1 Tax=Brevibacillus sp. 7WMA2 TaxID=2683193 RepID=UPI0013A74701|nr:TnsA endonuclease N-terminal domain-containing protein [Brevibacillus sp. 7WMA2]QIC04933.1 S-layer protein [Brevibacillus sp. 7WMA2]